jgi:hypothetical protein
MITIKKVHELGDIDVFTFHHIGGQRSLPAVEFDYLERDTGNYWRIWGANDLIYLYRMGEELASRDYETRIMEAGLMVRRLECALVMAKAGWFNFALIAAWSFGRLVITDSSTVTCWLKQAESENIDAVLDWFQAFSQHNLLRRAAEDAYNALTIPMEDILFMYRGFEWLKKCLKVSWKELGATIQVPQQNIITLKKMANNPDLATRHASESGKKLHFEQGVCAGWICGLLHGIVHARCQIDSTFAEKVKEFGDPWPI